MGIIGISGKINSGKDTVGEIVQIISASPHFTDEAVLSFIGRQHLNSIWEIKKFADKLKDIVCMLLNVDRTTLEDREFKEKELGKEWGRIITSDGEIHLPDDYPDLKYSKLTPRLLLQLLGTECGRQIIHPNIWVNALMSEYNCLECGENAAINGIETHKMPNWIITDMRFPNELEAVKSRGGITIRVNRNFHMDLPNGIHVETIRKGSLTEIEEHPSETALDNAEFDYTIENNSSIEDLIHIVSLVLKREKII